MSTDRCWCAHNERNAIVKVNLDCPLHGVGDTPRCCLLGPRECRDVAVYDIFGESPENATQSCEAHVGALLGTVRDGEALRWTVVPTGV